MPFKNRKIHIVSILVPVSWTKTDILTSVNKGMRLEANESRLEYDSMDVHATHLVDYRLEEQK